MTRKQSDHKPGAVTARAPRAVHVSCAPQGHGRVAVTVSVDPSEDLDAAGGVFVDVLLAGSDRASRKAELTRVGPSPIRSVANVAVRAPNDAQRLRPKARTAATSTGRTFTPHLIAPGRQIATGHAETFRSEIVLTGASPTGLSWFVRGRFATLGDDDLRSTWVRVADARSEA